MKHPKLLGLMVLTLTLFINQSCKKDEACEEKTWYHDGDADGEGDFVDTKKACDKPDGYVANANDPDDSNDKIFSGCTMATYYLDNDGDTFGDPDQALELCDGAAPPNKYVSDNTDCDDADPDIHPDVEVTFYLDNDGDGDGDPETSQTVSICNIPDNYVSNDADCNDDDPNINPSATEVPHDGIDSDCDGEEESIIPVTIWTGADITFTKESYADWTQPVNQDLITENVIITRQDDGPIYNFQWWQDTFLEDAIHVSNKESDLIEDFYDYGGAYGIHDYAKINPTGGTKRLRWAILDPGVGNYENSAWEKFNFYGKLGDHTHFYSFKNIFDMINYLDGNHDIITGVHSDFTLDYSEFVGIAKSFNVLVGKKLALWIEDENIYLTITINSWDKDYEVPGGGFSYTRSTPNY